MENPLEQRIAEQKRRIEQARENLRIAEAELEAFQEAAKIVARASRRATPVAESAEPGPEVRRRINHLYELLPADGKPMRLHDLLLAYGQVHGDLTRNQFTTVTRIPAFQALIEPAGLKGYWRRKISATSEDL